MRFSSISLAGALAVLACSEVPRAGRCDRTSDCAGMSAYATYVCNLDPTPQGNGRCVPTCQTSQDCAGGRICDFDSQRVGRCLFSTVPDGGQEDGGADGGGNDTATDSPHCPVCSGSTPVCLGVTCVECATTTDCSSNPAKPICDTNANACVPCTSDDQCVAKLGANPGVCMAHQNGRCATDAETIYVESKPSPGCNNVLLSDGDGTAALPLCTLELARRILASDSTQAQPRTLVRLRGTLSAATAPFTRTPSGPEVSLIGQQSALLGNVTAPAALDLQSGSFYVRGLKISPSASIGINATPGATDSLTLRLDGVTVDSCQQGGIFLGRAAFDIRNTTVTRNGPSMDLSWGGIRVDGLAANGPSQLEFVTVQNNNAAGISCATGASIQGSGVFADSNAAGNIASTCGFGGCSPVSATCGASP